MTCEQVHILNHALRDAASVAAVLVSRAQRSEGDVRTSGNISGRYCSLVGHRCYVRWGMA